MRRGDAPALGGLMSQSHASLRDLHEVSTPVLDAMVRAAEAVPGCLGARLVGAGFGGAVIALIDVPAEAPCRRAMAAAAATGGGAAWLVTPAAGMAARSPNVRGSS